MKKSKPHLIRNIIVIISKLILLHIVMILLTKEIKAQERQFKPEISYHLTFEPFLGQGRHWVNRHIHIGPHQDEPDRISF